MSRACGRARQRRSLPALALVAIVGNVPAADPPAMTLLSDAPLLPAWVAALEFDVTITADSVEWRGTALQQATVPLSMHGRTLKVERASALLGAGTVVVDAVHDATGHGQLMLTAKHVSLGEIDALRPYVQETPVDVTVDLEARGATSHALATSASGRIQLRNTGAGRIRKSVERAGANLLFNLFTANRSADEVTELECLALDLPVAEGVFERSVAMELRTSRLYVRGGGRIDFGREALDLHFNPEARTGIELQSLQAVTAVLVRGSFAEPEVKLDTGHLLTRAASLGLDVANLSGAAVIGAIIRGRDETSLCGAMRASSTAEVRCSGRIPCRNSRTGAE